MSGVAAQSQMPGFTQIPPNVFYGYLPPELWEKPKDLGYMQFTLLNLGINKSDNAVSENPAENGFLITAWSGLVVDAATGLVPVTAFPGFVIMKDSAQQELGNAPMPYLNVIGTAQLPAVVQWPKWVNPASKMTINVSNPTAAAVNVHITAWGFKVYPKGR